MKSTELKTRARKRRAVRVRKKVTGSAACPRLSVFRSLKHIYAQFVDDEKGATLGAVSTLSPTFREKHPGKAGTVAAARALGELAGDLAGTLGISRVVFDRAGYKYHGRVKALAEGARSRNLKF